MYIKSTSIISGDKIIEIYFIIDEFSKSYIPHSIEEDSAKKRRKRNSTLSQSEVITILVLFHYGEFRNLKHFYLYYIQTHITKEFPNTVSDNRFGELQKKDIIPLIIFLKTCFSVKYTGIYFTDSTPIRSLSRKKEKQHKTFKGNVP